MSERAAGLKSGDSGALPFVIIAPQDDQETIED